LTVRGPRVWLTIPIVGAVGTDAGTKLFDAADGGLVPIAFVAVTVHRYVLPFVSASPLKRVLRIRTEPRRDKPTPRPLRARTSRREARHS
jgi:hypothetical protein